MGAYSLMTKIVSLTGATVAGQPSETIISFLRELLAEAERGEITTIGVATVNPSGSVRSGLSYSGLPQGHHLTAACLYLLRHAERMAEVP